MKSTWLRKVHKCTLPIFIALLLAAKASCATLEAQVVSREVKKNLIEQIKQTYNGKTEVEVTALPFKSLELPDGDVKIKAELNLQAISSPTIARVSILVNDVKVRTFGARVELKIYDKVWIAKSWIQKGSSLYSVRLEEKEISSIQGGYVKQDSDPANYRARRNIRPGEVINTLSIEETPMIVENSPVSLIFQTSQVSVTVPATALTSGKRGDFIRVKSTNYKKSYVGKIIGENLVLVNI